MTVFSGSYVLKEYVHRAPRGRALGFLLVFGMSEGVDPACYAFYFFIVLQAPSRR